ncbi:hypothetical protein WA158_002122 [Blastocystis sp. Blastoise]
MIWGIGTDILYIPRISKILERHGDRFVKRVLNVEEQTIYYAHRDPVSFLASRWCSKEAIYKAVGCNGLNFNEIIIKHKVTNAFSGIPSVSFTGKTKLIIDPLHLSNIQISISHDQDYCIAYVLAVKES